MRHNRSHRLITPFLDDFNGLLLFMGPCRILQCYKYSSSSSAISFIGDNISEGFITKPLKKVLSDRRDSTSSDFSKIILDTIHGKDDLCMSIFLERLC